MRLTYFHYSPPLHYSHYSTQYRAIQCNSFVYNTSAIQAIPAPKSLLYTTTPPSLLKNRGRLFIAAQYIAHTRFRGVCFKLFTFNTYTTLHTIHCNIVCCSLFMPPLGAHLRVIRNRYSQCRLHCCSNNSIEVLGPVLVSWPVLINLRAIQLLLFELLLNCLSSAMQFNL